MLISVLCGVGGMGKTWLALHWAHQIADEFPDGHLFVDLRGFSPDAEPIAPETALRGFLDAFNVHPNRLPDDLHGRSALYRSLVAGRRMLIVLDNTASTDQITPLLPGSQTCVVLVTSRRALTTLVSRHGAHRFRLAPLTPAEACSFLVDRLGEARITAEPDAATELLGFCGGFAVALDLIAGQAHTHPHVPLSEFATELRELGLAALDNDDAPTACLPAVLSWSYRALTAQQQEVFSLLGIAPGPNITLLAAASLTKLSPARAGRVLRALVDTSLLDYDPAGRYAMHDLIRDYSATTAAQRLPAEMRKAASARVVDFYLYSAYAADRLLNTHRMPVPLDRPMRGTRPQSLGDARAAIAWFDAEQAALLAAQQTAIDHRWHFAVWWLARMMTNFHYRRGHRLDKLTVWKAALAAAEHLPDPTAQTHAHRLLGRAYADLGQHDEAIGHLTQALALAEHHHDPTQQAYTHLQLARAWGRRGHDQRALEHARQALQLIRVLDHSMAGADALNAVGWYSARLGDHGTARTHCRAALTEHQRQHDLTGEAAALDSLGYIDYHAGYHQDAIHHYRQALNLLRNLGALIEPLTHWTASAILMPLSASATGLRLRGGKPVLCTQN